MTINPFAGKIRKLITHPGRGHADDLYSSALLAALLPEIPIERREPSGQELADPSVLIYDTGRRHEPNRNNFDHHQMEKEETRCALSLILEQLGLRDKALKFWPWLRPSEILDTQGPKGLGEYLESDFRTQILPVMSPVEGIVLEWWSEQTTVRPQSEIHAFLQRMGQRLLGQLEEIAQRLTLLAETTEFVTVRSGMAEFEVAFLHIPKADKPSLHVERFWEEIGKTPVVSVSHDDRGAGTALYSHDTELLDFVPLQGREDIAFVTSSGWLAKTRQPLSKKEALETILGCVKNT
jgi:hypothetical protein